jgi:dihydroxyacetone kinase
MRNRSWNPQRACKDDVVNFEDHADSRKGAQKISPFPSVEDLVSQLLKLLCDQSDSERGFVKFSKDDNVLLLINNYGGLSNLEIGALTQQTLSVLGLFHDNESFKNTC